MGQVKSLKDGVIKIQDGSTPANSLTIVLEDGDLKFTVEKPIVEVMDRGTLAQAREGNDVSVKGSFTSKFVEFVSQTGAASPTPYEVWQGLGAGANWVTVDSNICAPKVFKVIFELATCVLGEQAERITFNKVHIIKMDFTEGEEDKLAMEFVDLEKSPTVAKY
jgi:hypothetical protein